MEKEKSAINKKEFLKLKIMRRIEKFKILIVGLTTVLSLINFSSKDFKHEIVQNELNKNIE
ncbi:hypothetical protein SAMN05444671_0455 [Flavobacterium sp. CF108]|uniref:hypothetical protein n=1 Tax=unclassified Flavobacterium TaxID=196869 RepID=UPI0008C204FB|nr:MULTISPECIES: hypothetical protein [unclassified Flavobacterium]SEO28192.1 hypothetical protein SAMN04487978_2635 [Flavobacterium sp. fv08]SHG44696.1 hypothetical protein SAMN05444671_0455 [Flavobacterium sp. CF108]